MDWVYLIGRILFTMIFLASGLNHLTQSQGMAQYAQSKGLPAAKAMVIISGVVLLAGGLSVLLGVYMEVGTWLVALFLLSAAFTMHNFWTLSDPAQKQVEQAMFMKNVSMAGAALMLYWYVQTTGYGPFTLGQGM